MLVYWKKLDPFSFWTTSAISFLTSKLLGSDSEFCWYHTSLNRSSTWWQKSCWKEEYIIRTKFVELLVLWNDNRFETLVKGLIKWKSIIWSNGFSAWQNSLKFKTMGKCFWGNFRWPLSIGSIKHFFLFILNWGPFLQFSHFFSQKFFIVYYIVWIL